jgi:hypothetical protein
MPASARHYPAGVNLTLVPFGEPALRHFMFLERPEGMDLKGARGIDAPIHEAMPLMAESDIVPQAQDFATVGHLYRSIEHGFDRLAEKFGERNLFVGPPRAQATSDYFHWPELVAVTDLASAHQAIDTILEQGEGARGRWQDAHFGQFVQILSEYRELKAASPNLEPARPVLFATVRPSEHDDRVPRITDDAASRCTDLFNVGYEVLLQLLQRYFAHTAETDAQLATLANAAVALMVGVLKPLGDLVTTLPVGPEQPGMTAGPSFELFYETDYLMPHREAAWALLEERVREAANFCGLIHESSDERVARELEHVRTALLRVAESLASDVGDRDPAREPTKGGTAAGDSVRDGKEQMGDRVTFEQDIRRLFRDRDIHSMSFAFDLSSYDDVRTNAEAIYEKLADGSMPCDGRWPTEDVQRFRTWIDNGSPP